MNRLSAIQWRSAYTYSLVVIAVMTIAGMLLWFRISTQFHNQYISQLDQQVSLLLGTSDFVEGWRDDATRLDDTVADIARATGADVTLYNMAGEVLSQQSESQTDVVRAPGPEMRSAENGETGIDWRNESDGVSSVYIAYPLFADGIQSDATELVGVIRFIFSAEQVEARLAAVNRLFLLTLLFATLAIIAALIIYSYRTTRSLKRLDDMVQRITHGDLGARVFTVNHGEVGSLALSLNRMADRLQSQTKKRRKERDRLNTVLRTMNDGIVILNRRGKVRSMNPAAARILDVSLRAAHKKSFVQVAKDYRIAAVWERCQNSNSEQYTTIELANDQSIHVVITPFLKRRARGYLVMIQDLTQLRHLQTVRQDFVSNVSHELRTPLASLRALVETLRDGALEDPPAARRFLDRMEVEVDALTQMVAELMELSRIESGQVPLELKSVHPEDVICPAVERLRPQAERNGIELSVDVPSDLPLVMADAERAQQVVMNLLHNAIKFTSKGDSVHVQAMVADDWLRFTVHDTGVGIAEEDLVRVFERFYKVDRSRTFSGTGLGLSISSHIVQQHGGEIWAESLEGEWSEFGFTLPLAEQNIDLVNTVSPVMVASD